MKNSISIITLLLTFGLSNSQTFKIKESGVFIPQKKKVILFENSAKKKIIFFKTNRVIYIKNNYICNKI